MKITALETLRTEEFSNVLWVRVHTDSGTIGLGETFYGAGAVEAHIHETFRRLPRNRHIEDSIKRWSTCRWRSRPRSNTGPPVDIALHTRKVRGRRYWSLLWLASSVQHPKARRGNCR
jgi:L-alanine-DL-glutamate epimerase-like enolase superfamily enzyme